MPTERTTIVPIASTRFNEEGKRALFIHGSVYISPYIYGTCRGRGNDEVTVSLVKIHKDDYSSYEAVTLYQDIGLHGDGELDARLIELNSVAYARNKLWLTRYRWALNQTDIIAVDPDTFEVEAVNHVAGGGGVSNEVNFALGGLFFFSDGIRVYKYDIDNDTIATFNLTPYKAAGTSPHSLTADATHVYVATSTGASGSSHAKVIKIQISDWSYVDDVDIPKATDDMCITESWIFCGYEVPSANTTDFGYGVGCIAVRKSDLSVFYLPKLGPEDTNSYTSYASLAFGDYLVDMRTNRRLYILDLTTDPATWTTESDMDDIAISDSDFTMPDILLNTAAGTGSNIPNELLVDEEGYVHAFCWPSGNAFAPDNPDTNDLTSGLIKFEVPAGLSFATLATVATAATTIDRILNRALLNGDLIALGGSTISKLGFLFGTVNPPTTELLVDEATEGEYSYQLAGLDDDATYYAQAFAQNDSGTATGDIVSFSVAPLANSIEGRVLYQGVPIANVDVYCVRVDNHTLAGHTTTNSLGEYTFTDLADSEYHLFVARRVGEQVYRASTKLYRQRFT